MIEQEFEANIASASGDLPLIAAAIRRLGSIAHDAGELIDQIARLEELKGTVAAAQARAAAAFADKQRAEQKAAGLPAAHVGKGIAAQIALARRESPHRGSRHLGLAEALVHELPHTMSALDAGQISEWRATLIARETACLTVEDRRQVDAELAARPGGLTTMGDRSIAAEARRIAYRLDPYAVTRRASKAAADRYVSLRPAPDAMTSLYALLPAQQGVAAYAALRKAADTARAEGDERGRGQVMADTLVQRLTGQATATAVPVEIQLVMTETTLLDGDNEPAELEGVGPLPAPLARSWLRDATTQPETEAAAWLRRLFTSPTTGQLIAMDSRRRCFDGLLRRFVIAADRTCRTPWCDAPIRHIDHSLRAAEGGDTRADNGAGLCEACNYTREVPGWTTSRLPNRVLEIRTPTGHRYGSRPPPPVGQKAEVWDASPSPPTSVLEERPRDVLAS